MRLRKAYIIASRGDGWLYPRWFRKKRNIRRLLKYAKRRRYY